MARFLKILWLAAAFAGVSSSPGGAGPQPGATARVDSTALARECEYGIAMALLGDYGLADSIFVSLLSHARESAAALNNLGNLQLLQARPDEALVFYAMAARADSADAGIQLNRALALWVAGHPDEALVAGGRGTQLAGGEAAAAALLGLPPEGAEPAERGADAVAPSPAKPAGAVAASRPHISRSEVRALLRGAAARVPPSAPAGGDTAGYAKGRVVSRSAGTRAADASDLGSVLYWKL